VSKLPDHKPSEKPCGPTGHAIVEEEDWEDPYLADGPEYGSREAGMEPHEPVASDGPDETEGASSEGLTEQERLVAVALATGRTHAQAGELVGRSAKWVQRRLRCEAFANLVDQERRRHFEQITGRLIHGSSAAVEALIELLACDQPGVQIRAAQSILANGSRYHRQIVDHHLEDRFDQLEELLRSRRQA
jgi:hypothetical protein